MERLRRRADSYKALIVLIILNSLEFPGNLTTVFGSFTDPLMGYTCFMLEIIIMLLSSGKSFYEIRLVDLKRKYRYIYILLAIFFVNSMMVTSFPKEQIISCVRFSVTVLFALWIVETYDTEEILEMIYFAQAIYLIASMAFAVIRPSIAYSASEGGFAFLKQAKNSAASQFVLAISMQAILLKCKLDKKEKISRIFLCILMGQIVALVMCNSVGAMLCLLIVLFYTFVISRKLGMRRRLNLGVWYVVISVGFLFVMMTIAPFFNPVFKMLGKDATLTGRTPLWEQIIKVMTRYNTLQGFGYSMFWRDPKAYDLIHRAFDRYSWLANMTTGAHNVILELWLNVGLMGIGIYFVALIQSMSHTRYMSEAQYLTCSAYLIAFTIHGLTERAFVTYDYQTLFCFLIMATGCKAQPHGGQHERKNQRNHPGLQRGGLFAGLHQLRTGTNVFKR